MDEFEGMYMVNEDPGNIVKVNRVGYWIYDVQSLGLWKGTGFFDGKVYWGVYEYDYNFHCKHLAGTRGTHHGIVDQTYVNVLRLDVQFSNIIGQVGSGMITWEKVKMR